MRVVFATAEMAPLVRVGGLAEAAGGLVRALRRAGVDVHVLVPDYFGTPLEHQTEMELDVPEWVGYAQVRTGSLDGFGEVSLVEAPLLARVSAYGHWDDDKRFFGFSTAVGAYADRIDADILHVNDWHTGAALAFSAHRRPSVCSIHNLAYQGQSDPGWLLVFGDAAGAYDHYGACNPLAGAVTLADRVVAVSPNYAREICGPADGFGLDGLLRSKGAALSGILNGIDTDDWSPRTDAHLPAPFDHRRMAGKQKCRAKLLKEAGLLEGSGPVLGMVTRIVDQKGVDLVTPLGPFLAGLDARLIILGSGDPELVAQAAEMATSYPVQVAFFEGYDLPRSHRVFGGCDLYLMPSRFEPCGLAQMQAMAYGAIPVVSDVGGLHDTVVDADDDPAGGTGFRTRQVDALGLLDAVHRAAQAWRDPARRKAMQQRGMAHDWSWDAPAARYRALYAGLLEHPAGQPAGAVGVDG